MKPSFWFEIKKPKRRDGPYENRQDAVAAAFKVCPDAKEVCVGYGSHGPWFDIRWHRNPRS